MSASVAYQRSIEELPDEMLEKVFGSLDSASLKKCCLVSQKWNSVIGQSLNIMKQLPLTLKGSWLRNLQETKDFNRKYHTINIRKMNDWTDNALKVLSKHGSDSRWIQFAYCKFDNSSLGMFGKTLESFRNVEKITFKQNNISPSISLKSWNQLKKTKPVNLPSLKSVVLSSSLGSTCLLLLEFMKSSQLKSLKIFGYYWFNSAEAEEGNLFTFLATQTELEELALRDVYLNFELIELSDIKKIKIPLKRLSLKLGRRLNSSNEEKCLAFLNRFAGTLEDLELHGYCVPDSVFEMIFTKFKKLRVAKIDRLPKENVFYHNLCPNTAVRKLVVDGHDVQHAASLEGVIGNLPNIQTLVLNFHVPGKLMQFVANNLRSLEILHVRSATGKTFNRVQLPSVRTISFEKMSIVKTNEWTQIVKALPNIETMSVQEVCLENSMSSFDFNIFTKGWANLTHLKIGKGFVAYERKFNHLLRNCKKIQTVELAESAFWFGGEVTKSDIFLRDFQKDGLRFIIHADGDIHKIFPKTNAGKMVTRLLQSSDSEDD